ncbi:hypothetical protein FRC11_013248, partial [Ceratobasidium sp. 423]
MNNPAEGGRKFSVNRLESTSESNTQPGPRQIATQKVDGKKKRKQVNSPQLLLIVYHRLIKTTILKWFMGRSGGGHRFRLAHKGLYLLVANIDDHGLVIASMYQGTRAFLKANDGRHAIKFPENDRLLDIPFSNMENGSEPTRLTVSGSDVGGHIKDQEETVRVSQKPATTEKGQQLKDPSQSLGELRKEIVEMRAEITKMERALGQREGTTRQRQEELKTREPGSNSPEVRSQQRRAEIVSLQAKVDRLEWITSG